MKKQIYTKAGRLLASTETKHLVRLDGSKELNPSALTSVELLQTCGLYEYEPPKNKKANGKPTRAGKLIYNEQTGTCTRELVELTLEELAEQQEAEARMEFEAEQEAQREAKNEQEFLEWKAKKEKAAKNIN